MGFFSQQCYGCHLSILAPYDLHHSNRWLNHFVAIQKDGKLHSGWYDGYGRTDSADERDERTEKDWAAIEADDDHPAARSIGCTWDGRGNPNGSGPTVWHEACWLAAGSPRAWKGESPNAADQGYFFDAEDYATRRPPKSPAGLMRLRASADKLNTRRQRALEREMAKYQRREAN